MQTERLNGETKLIDGKFAVSGEYDKPDALTEEDTLMSQTRLPTINIPQWAIAAFLIPVVLLVFYVAVFKTGTERDLEAAKAKAIDLEKALDKEIGERREESRRRKSDRDLMMAYIYSLKSAVDRGKSAPDIPTELLKDKE